MTSHRYPNGVELRQAFELRAVGRQLVGYASVFNSETRIGGRFLEVIRPGAFAVSLASGSDVVATVDHDTARLLGRTKSGTLRLAEDARGLAFSIDIPDTQTGRDALTLAERGDLGGASFSFRATDEAWSASRDRREIRACELLEVCVVSAWPAYAGTSVAARGREQGPTRLQLYCATL